MQRKALTLESYILHVKTSYQAKCTVKSGALIQSQVGTHILTELASIYKISMGVVVLKLSID